MNTILLSRPPAPSAARDDGYTVKTLSRTGADGLGVSAIGPSSLLPQGGVCGILFERDGTVTIMLGARDYGQGYASPYFANLLSSRLGVPFGRVRLYYPGTYPAMRRTPNNRVPGRANVSASTIGIGDVLEALCDRVIERGCRFVALLAGVDATDVRFHGSSGRFRVTGGEQSVHILDLAQQARHARYRPGQAWQAHASPLCAHVASLMPSGRRSEADALE